MTDETKKITIGQSGHTYAVVTTFGTYYVFGVNDFKLDIFAQLLFFEGDFGTAGFCLSQVLTWYIYQ
jgi:hypothetical protein